MSRIHDALKKAEQDRTAGSPLDWSAVEPVPANKPAPEDERLRSVAAVTLPLPGMQGGGSISLENWISTCPASPWKPNPQTALFTNPGSRQLGVEEFRTLRTHLSQMREKLPLQTVLVTSALPGEGKTFVAVNLAQAFAQQKGKRVLLIDCDLRISRVHMELGAARSPGLSEFLQGQAEIPAILQRGDPDSLFLIPGGAGAASPMELLGGARLKGLLHRLAPLFDWIILDSPPCVPLSDASLLADVSDGVLMVVQCGKTPFDIAQKGSRQFRDKRLLGVVLNQVEPQAAYSAYYYYAGAQHPALKDT